MLDILTYLMQMVLSMVTHNKQSACIEYDPWMSPITCQENSYSLTNNQVSTHALYSSLQSRLCTLGDSELKTAIHPGRMSRYFGSTMIKQAQQHH